MTTRRSLRGAPEVLQDAENMLPTAGTSKHTLQSKKLGKPRAAFTELTNAIEKGLNGGKKSLSKLVVKKGRVHRTAEEDAENAAADPPRLTAIRPRAAVKRTAAAAASNASNAAATATEAPAPSKKARRLRSVPTLPDLTSAAVSACSLVSESVSSGSSASFQTPPEGSSPESQSEAERHAELVARLNAENGSRRPRLPDGVLDFDDENKDDMFGVPEYVCDVFKYYRQREATVCVARYLETVQTDLTEMMRAILVDWMVEVQESFELNHETLYLAVRLVDLYLGHAEVNRETLQLIGATAIFMACKFDERLPPPLDDFLYICEDAYARREVIQTEMKMLTAVNFDLGLPLSYRFLRRYARCCKLSLEVLTLARYILETSLMEYSLVTEAGSRVAAAALSLAVLMRLGSDAFHQLRPTIEHFSGYKTIEFTGLVSSLNVMLLKEPSPHLKTIRAKYSHSVFHEVAKIPCLDAVPAL